MKHFDYIISGAGAAGLILARGMAADAFFEDKSIALIDLEKKKGNDRTWCFWENGNGQWDEVLTKSWKNIFFGGPGYEQRLDIKPYVYKMIRSENFYKQIWKTLDKAPNITFIQGKVQSISETGDGAVVSTDQEQFSAKKVFNSVILNRDYEKQTKYPLLQQHFLGWFVKTAKAHFDEDMATFMDFRVPQRSNTRFMYVLPMNKKTALFEYTLFSENLLEQSEYEEEIRNYLDKHGITDYSIEETEKGSIPMTAYNFGKHNTRNIINIGTAGGWTKASTGYTFMNTSKKAVELIKFLKKETDLSKFSRRNKFWFYDLILLDVLTDANHLGAKLFTGLFKRTKATTILKFLDDETSFREDLSIITSMPILLFSKTLFRRLFRL
ncbi:MAG: lycopene cyclase [Bacteroidetes bacterium]|nr:MAG: lycopene cyclase [Bacteroidota bacterium]